MTMKQAERLHRLYSSMEKLGFNRIETNALIRIERALQRWGEKECGDGSNWAIERDETTGKPFNVYHGEGKSRRYPIADLEAGALKRLAKIMAQHPELVAYHQGDCRGCNLSILRKSDIRPGETIDCVYNRGIAVCY